jgi:hypothetical protein
MGKNSNSNSQTAHDARPVERIPPGAKKVTRTSTTREDFIEDLESKKPTVLLEGLDEGEDAENLADDDIDEGEFELDPPEELSPMEKFLVSLRDQAGEGNVRIYAVRQPDPMGITFRNPSKTQYTAGDVPYDENDLYIEALEVAIQKLYGGGRYQIKALKNGAYAGATTRIIHDAPEQREQSHSQPPPQYAPTPPPAEAQPQRQPLAEVHDALELVKEIWNIRGGQQAPPPARELPPADPMASVRDTFSLFKEFRGELSSVVSDSAPTGSERHWSEGLLNGAARLFDSLHIGPVVEEGGKFLFSAFAAAQAAAQREANAANQANGAPAVTASRGSGEPAALTPGNVTAPTDQHGESAAASAAAWPPPAESAPTISAAELAVLTTVVEEIRGYENDSDSEQLETRVARAVSAVRTLPREMLDQLLPLPNAFLLVYICSVNPAWADLADMRDAQDFIGELKAALAAPDVEGTATALEFPPLREVATTQEGK